MHGIFMVFCVSNVGSKKKALVWGSTEARGFYGHLKSNNHCSVDVPLLH